MHYIRKGIMNEYQRRTQNTISLRALSIEDIFSGNVTAIPQLFVEITKAIQEDIEPHSEEFFPSVYGFLSVLLAYVQGADVLPKSEYRGCDVLQTLIICDTDVRKAIYQSIAMARKSQNISSSGFRKDREGLRMKELCIALLRGYGIEALLKSSSELSLSQVSAEIRDVPTDSPEAFLDVCRGQRMRPFVAPIESTKTPLSTIESTYKEALEECVNLLLELNYISTAFCISAQHLYSAGIMKAVDQSRENLRPHFFEFLRLKGSCLGTNGEAVALECLEWLETHASSLPAESSDCFSRFRTDEILELGEHVDSFLLDSFFADKDKERQYLKWLHSTRVKSDFAAAAIYAMETLGKPMKSKCGTPLTAAKTIMSLAKLSSKAASADATDNKVELSKAKDKAKRGLLEVKSQQELISLRGDKSSDLALLKSELLIDAMQETFCKWKRGGISVDIAKTEEEVFPFVTLMLALLTEQINDNVKGSESKTDEELNKLWSNVILFDIPLLFQEEDKGTSEENHTLLFKLLKENYRDAMTGNISPDVLLNDKIMSNLALEDSSLTNALVNTRETVEDVVGKVKQLLEEWERELL